MRIYTKKYYSETGMSLMHRLSNLNTTVDEYRSTFYELGEILGQVLNSEIENMHGKAMLACASEDADWLVSGVLSKFSYEPSLAIFWNERVKLSKDGSNEISPIIKSYIEPINDCQILILVKSIISTSCVVKTQLTRLINTVNPENIYIVSPVMYVEAERSLRKEFPEFITNKFKFITLAIDDKRDDEGNIRPGIGGMVYPRLGLGDFNEKNRYIPTLVKDRMSKLL